MSRIGQQPITIPSGVDVSIDGGRVAVKGPKGELDYTLVGGVSVSRNDDGKRGNSANPEHGCIPAGVAGGRETYVPEQRLLSSGASPLQLHW